MFVVWKNSNHHVPTALLEPGGKLKHARHGRAAYSLGQLLCRQNAPHNMNTLVEHRIPRFEGLDNVCPRTAAVQQRSQLKAQGTAQLVNSIFVRRKDGGPFDSLTGESQVPSSSSTR